MSGLNLEGPIASPMSQPSIEGSTKSNQTGSIKGHSTSQNSQKLNNLNNKIKSLFSSKATKSTTGEQTIKSKRGGFSAKVTPLKSKDSESATNPTELIEKKLKEKEKAERLTKALKQVGLA
jgi:hypothetical protein